VIWAYMRALGGPLAVGTLLLGFISAEVLRVGATVWLSYWTGERTKGGREG
jgi:hypothetical protein